MTKKAATAKPTKPTKIKPTPNGKPLAAARAHTIGTLIDSLNAKSDQAGCDVHAEPFLIDSTWGNHSGVALVGGTAQDRERAATYVTAYYRKHLEQQRTYNAQFGLTDLGEKTLARGKSQLHNPAYCWGSEHLAKLEARVIGLLYSPCAD